MSPRRNDFAIEPLSDGRTVLTYKGSAVITDDAAEYVIAMLKMVRVFRNGMFKERNKEKEHD